MLSPSEFNNAVPKFTNGNYANNPVDPQYIEEPTLQDYNRGVEPLETLPAQWWNWLCNQFTSRFNKINTYVKNIFDEITQLLSLLNISPDGTESAITTGQLKDFFKELYPTYVSDKLELGTTYVPQTRTVNGHELTGNITITKSDVGLGNVDNTSDVDKPVSTAQATAISTAINALDVASVGGSGKYLSAISETDGKISATAGDIDSAVTANSNNLITSGGVAGALLDKENFINMGELNKATLDDLLLYIYQIIDKSSMTGTGVWIGHSIFKFSTYWIGSGVEMLINLEFDGYYRVLFRNGSIYYKERIITTADVTNQVTNGDSAPVSSGAVADILSNLPTDAVLHYSFDEVPDYPDGPADVRLLNNNTYQIQSTDYAFKNNAHATFSDNNGLLKIVTASNSLYDGVFLDSNFTLNKVIKLKLKVTSLTSGGWINIVNGVNPINNVQSITRVGTYEIALVNKNNSQNKNIYIFTNSGSTSEVIVEQIYIGDGSYSTPVIDNANGKWNGVNYGVQVAKGVSGRGLNFIQGAEKNIKIPYNFTQLNGTSLTWSISFWGKIGRGSETTGKNPRIYTFGLFDYIFIDNYYQGYTGYNIIMFVSHYSDSENLWADIPAPSDLGDKFHHFTVVTELNLSGTSYKKVYIDGVLKRTVTSSTIQHIPSGDFGYLGGNANTQYLENSQIDDFQIFDRALTEKEVVALYNNKANTPKYYNLNNYKIDNANVAEEGGTGKYIESIKQEGGLIVPVEQTIDTAPVNASTKPITSGTMYNFLGGNTSAQSWLGKVFGWALGRNWSEGSGFSLGNINSIYYANGKWVAVGKDIYESTDGINWTSQGFKSQNVNFTSVYYANGMWVACTTTNTNSFGIIYNDTTHGWTWAPSTNQILCKDAYYSNGIWVACKVNGGLLWSSTGESWTDCTGTNIVADCVYYANNIWVAGGNKFAYSSDGKTWNEYWVGSTTYVIKDFTYAFFDFVTYENGYLALDETRVYKSNNGSSWTSSIPAPSGVTYNCFCVVNGTLVLGTNKGIYWASITSGYPQKCDNPYNDSNADFGNIESIQYANGVWLAGSTSGNLYRSLDGKIWNRVVFTSTTVVSQFKAIHYANGMWVASGQDKPYYSNYFNANLQ